MSKKTNLIYVFLLIFFSLILLKLTANSTKIATLNTGSQEYMQDFHLTNYDEQGLIKNTISANFWQYNQSQQNSDLANPKIIIYKPNGNIYKISAQAAKALHKTINSKIELIKLFNNVYSEQKQFNLKTSYLEYDVQKELADTKEFVTIAKPGLTLTGTGMHANLNNNQLQLHHNVKTIFNHNAK